jgi:hypothetical protein
MSGLTIGATYYISVSGVAGTAAAKSIRITTNADGSTGALFTQVITGTSITYSFVATATTHYLALIVTGGAENQTFSVSQASVKQITAITGMPSTYTRNNGGRFPARFDYDPATLAPKGILIEEQRTNLLTYSEQFDNGIWQVLSGATKTANTTVSPDGTTNADTFTATNASSGVYQTQTASNSVAYTTTIYLKAGTISLVRFGLTNQNESANAFYSFTLTGNGSVAFFTNVGFTANSASITPAGNGWYRCVVTATSPSTGTTAVGPMIRLSAGGTAFVWGAQLEAGAFATSYIPTVASQVTRAADQCTITAPMFAPWYNQTEGTFVVDWFIDHANAAGRYVIKAVSPTISQGYGIWLNANSIETRAWVGATSVIAGNASIVTRNKAAFAYKAADNAVSLNGAASVTSAATGPTDVNSFEIGSSGLFNGHIRSVQYYPVRLADFQLQALSA